MTFLWGPLSTLLFLLSSSSASAQQPFEAPEPFRFLNDVCLDCGPAAPSSPDPLVRAQWSDTTNLTKLQIYRVTQPVAITVNPPYALQGWKEWLSGESTTLLVKEPCNVTIDWGVERAAWFEFLANTSSGVQAGISEFNTPYPGKTKAPIKYGSQTYRLETNKELYEGVRYTFLCFSQPAVKISNISLVAKVKPIAYSGSYSSSHTLLEQSWYTGAYGVRLNMEATQFNSILIERGDRVAIQGDAHPSMATALAGFGSPYLYSFVQSELWQTNSGHVHGHNVVDQNIMAYPLYWCLSVLDWYYASGNHTGFQELVPDVRSILDERINTYLDLNQDIVWMGWDDRLGNGWCYHSNNDTCPLEGHYTLAGLIARVCKDLAQSLKAVGDDDLAQQYHETHQSLVQKFQDQVPHDQVGVHAVANMINADIVTDETAIQEWIQTKLNDAATICSWSPFNQYWILQAFAHDVERGLASIELCWGPMLKINKGCFWELSGPDWPTFLHQGDMAPTMPSLCHPWASGVTAWLSKVHGGILPLSPGYQTVLVAPYVSVNHPNVSTTMPSAQGSVHVNATLDKDHTLSMDVDSPVGVGTYVGLRRNIWGACEMKPATIVLNGQVALELLTGEDLKDYDLPAHTKKMAFLRMPKGGRNSIRVSYSCTAGVKEQSRARGSPFPPPHYPASVSFDRESKGDGLAKYGKDGYTLLGYNEDKSDLENLPDYVDSLQIRNHGWGGWKELPRTYVGISPDNPTYIPNPLNATAPRALGRIGYGEPGYWDPGVLVEVELKARNAQESVMVDVQTTSQQKQKTYQFSIYCVGVGDHAVRIMDLATLDPIAPTMHVDQYQEGVWYTVSYTKSIRLRVMAMYGIQISAVAFASTEVGIQQTSKASVSPFPPPHYPASVSFDRESKGDGLTKHGQDGYLLLGYNQDQSDMEKLPSYVKSLHVQDHGWNGWHEKPRAYLGSSATNATFIPNPLDASAPRALGVVSQDDKGSQGILIDVEFAEEESIDVQAKQYTVSIYCVGNGKHAVRIMDLHSLDPIAPTAFVDQYEEGVWYTVSYTKSMRLRAMGIHGIQFSAIAFGSHIAIQTASQ